MSLNGLAAAMHRMTAVLERRPQFGLHEDASATSVWQGGTRVVSSHANGTTMATDMPVELGGTGDQVSPGWMFRAGLASCAATCIAMAAAEAGIELTTLEVVASSRSDVRGLLGLRDERGEPVSAGPCDLTLHVRIAARDASPERVRELVHASQRTSPIPTAVKVATPVSVSIDVVDA